MVQLTDADIHTREVTRWKGLHVFHGRMSSCSQKLRILLNLKNIAWEGHELDLASSETYSEWFLGVNPRGLVPVLVWDGAVHIESNDILSLLDEHFPEPRLVPPSQRDEIGELLRREDDLHLDLRTLSFRFVVGRTRSNKTSDMMARYRAWPATVGGQIDQASRAKELAFYERLAGEGIPDDTVREAAARFKKAFDDIELQLARGPWILGDTLTLLDIAWFVYASRLQLAGYPFERIHPHVHAWRERLAADERFAREVAPPAALEAVMARNHAKWAQCGQTFTDVTGF